MTAPPAASAPSAPQSQTLPHAHSPTLFSLQPKRRRLKHNNKSNPLQLLHPHPGVCLPPVLHTFTTHTAKSDRAMSILSELRNGKGPSPSFDKSLIVFCRLCTAESHLRDKSSARTTSKQAHSDAYADKPRRASFRVTAKNVDFAAKPS